MNSKWIVGIIAALVVIVGSLFIFSNRYSPSAPATPAPTQASTQTQTQPTAAPTSGSVTTTPSTTSEQVITLTQNGFSPATLTIKAGTTVSWENKSGSDATVNSAPHPAHTDFPPLNLGTFPDGGKLSLTFDKPGTYRYHNHFNASQKGTIIVQ